jgi:hypothetical protein
MGKKKKDSFYTIEMLETSCSGRSPVVEIMAYMFFLNYEMKQNMKLSTI